MKPSEIHLLFKYDQWAMQRIFEHASQLTSVEFNQLQDFPHGGVRTTLVHILSAVWIWRMRVQEGQSPTAPLSAWEFITLENIIKRWERETNLMGQYLSELTETDLDQKVQYRRTDGSTQNGVLWQLLIHLINHGTTHRSEVAAMLTSFKHSPGDLDLTVYLRSLTR